MVWGTPANGTETPQKIMKTKKQTVQKLENAEHNHCQGIKKTWT